jgi:phage terminase large subunit GpA-like protein
LPVWVEKNFRLPERSSAQPGRFKLWKCQWGFLEAIGDPLCERVTVIKSARIGFTKCLMATIGAYAANDPCSVILLVPTDDDARRYAVDEIEPSFAELPALRDLIQRGRLDGRNTLVMKAFAGGGNRSCGALSRSAVVYFSLRTAIQNPPTQRKSELRYIGTRLLRPRSRSLPNGEATP